MSSQIDYMTFEDAKHRLENPKDCYDPDLLAMRVILKYILERMEVANNLLKESMEIEPHHSESEMIIKQKRGRPKKSNILS